MPPKTKRSEPPRITARAGPSAGREGVISDETYTITDLEQVRVLADPLRLKLLGAFGRPRTTKQVADLLGEKPTKLYHHVEALERVGLISLKETRPNRGTLEKYFQAVAGRFQVGPSVFSPRDASAPEASAAESVLLSILDTTRRDLAALANAPGVEGGPSRQAIVARVLLRADPERAEAFRARLLALVDQLKSECEASEPAGPDVSTYGLTLAFYPAPLIASEPEPDKP